MSTADCPGTTVGRIRITHPFHPQSGRAFELVCRRRHWGEDRVIYLDDGGRLHSVAADLTDIDPPDEFRRVAAGSAAFHPVDLLALCAVLERFMSCGRVKAISPLCKPNYAAGETDREHRS